MRSRPAPDPPAAPPASPHHDANSGWQVLLLADEDAPKLTRPGLVRILEAQVRTEGDPNCAGAPPMH
jgi:hypothetical protein